MVTRRVLYFYWYSFAGCYIWRNSEIFTLHVNCFEMVEDTKTNK